MKSREIVLFIKEYGLYNMEELPVGLLNAEFVRTVNISCSKFIELTGNKKINHTNVYLSVDYLN